MLTVSGLRKFLLVPEINITNLCLMEHQSLFHLRLGIILSLLAVISYSKHSSSYITEAYFQKYDSLIDPIFQDFISNKIPPSFCKTLETKHNFSPKLSVTKRQLIGEGSHRRLTSSIKIKKQQNVLSNLPSLACKAIIVERLPSGVFADPFELEHLTQRGVFSDASVFGDTDLELPTVRANRSVVEIHMDLGPNIFSGNRNGQELNIELPLHTRYAPLGTRGYTRVEFGSPDLFVHCEDSDNQSCIFSSTNDEIRSNYVPIFWEVPSGIVTHTKIVPVLTFISAVVAAFSVFIVCVFY